MTSLSMISNRKMIFRAGQGAGKSGSFFFESFDKRFIIKSISSSEKKVLLNLLDDLIQHLEQTTLNKSLLARIYGIFTIKTEYFDPV